MTADSPSYPRQSLTSTPTVNSVQPANSTPSSTPQPRVVVLIPAGGGSARLGGVDKTRLPLGNSTVLATLLTATAAWDRIVVGHEAGDLGPTFPQVRWCREDPPGGGPVAALAAGLALAPDAEIVVALAGDQPWAAAAVPRLLGALADPGAEAAVGSVNGRGQWLLAAYRAAWLRTELGDGGQGRSMRALVQGRTLVDVPVSDIEAFDIDTPDDLREASTRI